MRTDWLLTPPQVAALPEAGARAVAGGKAASLARLTAWGNGRVPPWFVLTPDLLRRTLGEERWAALAAASPADAAAIFAGVQLRAEDTARIAAAAGAISPAPGARFAVRSSGVDEDGVSHSFAGQFESHLDVAPDRFAAKILDVWRSAWSPRIAAYRAQRGLPQRTACPAVIIQRMVPAEFAGVAFGIDAVTGDPSRAIVAVVRGLGESLVSGAADAETFAVDPAGCVESHGDHAPERTGVSAATVAEAARLTRALGDLFGSPQDVEWAAVSGSVFLLQSRPITTLTRGSTPAPAPKDTGELRIWDNSNIAESYGGVTLPLTFSFARRAYEEVYRSFCGLMGVPSPRIHGAAPVFRNMLGLIRGRVYYNLLNWYRLLALLPGYTLNRRFMEQMMGVREPLAPELDALIQPPRAASRLRDAFDLARSVAGLLWNHTRLPATRRDFLARLNAALDGDHERLATLSADELVAHYRALESALLTRWDAPIVNDFFAMIWHGVLRKLCARWGDPASPDAAPALANDLVGGDGGIISAEPAERMLAMAEIARADPALARALAEGSPDETHRAIEASPAFRAAYQEYLARFADRCLDELKLESPTTSDDPTTFLRAVGRIALAPARPAPSQLTPAAAARRDAEARIRANLRFRPLRWVLFNAVLRRARTRVRDRENLRFERTRVFGRVRRIFLELGRRLHERSLLNSPEDVFYLQVEEVLGFVEGTAADADLRSLVSLRRREYDAHRAGPVPPDRFTTRGPVHLASLAADAPPAPIDAADPDRRRGLGCCSGVVRGVVRVIRDPRVESLVPGEILVAERTDPGWVAVFPAASGILVQRGSLLSHSAIVAREMGIPAVVAVHGLLDWLRTGDEVEFDGAVGDIRRIRPASTEPTDA